LIDNLQTATSYLNFTSGAAIFSLLDKLEDSIDLMMLSCQLAGTSGFVGRNRRIVQSSAFLNYAKPMMMILKDDASELAASLLLLLNSSNSLEQAVSLQAITNHKLISDRNFSSPLLKLVFSNYDDCVGEGCAFAITTRNINGVRNTPIVPWRQSFNCSLGQKEVFNLTCSDATYNITCDGSFDGIILGTCPYNTVDPICALVDDDFIISSSHICTASVVDADHVRCNCILEYGMAAPMSLKGELASQVSNEGGSIMLVTYQQHMLYPLAVVKTIFPPTKSQNLFPTYLVEMRTWVLLSNVSISTLENLEVSALEAGLHGVLGISNFSYISVNLLNVSSVVDPLDSSTLLQFSVHLNASAYCTIEALVDEYQQALRYSVVNTTLYLDTVLDFMQTLSSNGTDDTILQYATTTFTYSRLFSSRVIPTISDYCASTGTQGTGDSVLRSVASSWMQLLSLHDLAIVIVVLVFVILTVLYMWLSNRLPGLFISLSAEEKLRRQSRKEIIDADSDSGSVRTSLTGVSDYVNWLLSSRADKSARDDVSVVSTDSFASSSSQNSIAFWIGSPFRGKASSHLDLMAPLGSRVSQDSNSKDSSFYGMHGMTSIQGTTTKKLSWKQSMDKMFGGKENEKSLVLTELDVSGRQPIFGDAGQSLACPSSLEHDGVDSFYLARVEGKDASSKEYKDSNRLPNELKSSTNLPRIDSQYGIELVDEVDDGEQPNPIVQTESPSSALQSLYSGVFGSNKWNQRSSSKKLGSINLQALGSASKAEGTSGKKFVAAESFYASQQVSSASIDSIDMKMKSIDIGKEASVVDAVQTGDIMPLASSTGPTRSSADRSTWQLLYEGVFGGGGAHQKHTMRKKSGTMSLQSLGDQTHSTSFILTPDDVQDQRPDDDDVKQFFSLAVASSDSAMASSAHGTNGIVIPQSAIDEFN